MPEPAAELEELVEPLQNGCQSSPLAPGVVLTASTGLSFRIVSLLKDEPHARLYEAGVEGSGKPVWLRETCEEQHSHRFRHEAHVLEGLESRAFPKVLACFSNDGATYQVAAPIAGTTYASLLAHPDTQLSQIVTVLAQVASALSHLHQRGWVHLGLRPTAVILGKPVKIIDLSYAGRIGDTLAPSFYHAGYSAPELLTGEPLDVRADIYAVGALLYHAVNGHAIGEAGVELCAWHPPRLVPGVPQILHRCLGEPASRYATMTELHRELLRLAHRLAPRVYHLIGAATSIGLEPTRGTNQDAYAYLNGQTESDDGAKAWSVACLADGMGGMAVGEVASAVAVQAVIASAAGSLPATQSLSAEAQAQLVKGWVAAANENVCAALEARRARGGCTLICACVVGSRLTIGHVGDCRLYLLRNSQATLLTRDHSLAMSLVQQGELPMEELRRHPDRNKVLRSLGERHPLPDHFVDTLEQTNGGATLDLLAGDLLVLCCDGLWEPVLETDMIDILATTGEDPATAADGLLKLALARGGADNATAVILRVQESPINTGNVNHAEHHPATTPREPAIGNGEVTESVRRVEGDPETRGGAGAAAASVRAGD